MPLAITLRDAGVQDAPAISLLHAQSWREGYRGLLPQAYLDGLSESHWVRPFSLWLSGGDVFAKLAYVNGAPAGAAAYGRMQGAFLEQARAPEGWGYVLSLYVAPAFFNRGVGSALLCAAEQALFSLGYTHAFLYVLDSNLRARGFYERRGYAWDGERLAVDVGGVTVTDLRYVKRL